MHQHHQRHPMMIQSLNTATNVASLLHGKNLFQFHLNWIEFNLFLKIISHWTVPGLKRLFWDIINFWVEHNSHKTLPHHHRSLISIIRSFSRRDLTLTSRSRDLGKIQKSIRHNSNNNNYLLQRSQCRHWVGGGCERRWIFKIPEHQISTLEFSFVSRTWMESFHFSKHNFLSHLLHFLLLCFQYFHGLFFFFLILLWIS